MLELSRAVPHAGNLFVFSWIPWTTVLYDFTLVGTFAFCVLLAVLTKYPMSWETVTGCFFVPDLVGLMLAPTLYWLVFAAYAIPATAIAAATASSRAFRIAPPYRDRSAAPTATHTCAPTVG